MGLSYYDILNLPTNANNEEIKNAYKKLSLQYHPDKNKEENGNKFSQINEAYTILSDADKRMKYDNGTLDTEDSSEFLFTSNVPNNIEVFFKLFESSFFNSASFPSRKLDTKKIKVSLLEIYQQRYKKIDNHLVDLLCPRNIFDDIIFEIEITNRDKWLIDRYDLHFIKKINMDHFLNGINWVLKLPNNKNIIVKHSSWLNMPLKLQKIEGKGLPFDESHRGDIYVCYIVTEMK